MALLNVVGFDPSMTHWGIAKGEYCTDTRELISVKTINVTVPVKPTGKQVRKNSQDLEVALQLATAAREATQGADAIFVEIPTGSQSASAMKSYGMCIGILADFRSCGIPFFEVTPNEVKLATVGTKSATKKQMIDWATDKFPEANWPTYKRKGVLHISDGKAEHMADAIAAIIAGSQSNTFQQFLQFTAKFTQSA